MNKKNSKKFLEILILLTIITSIIIVILVAQNTLTKSPQLSNSNEIENYSITTYYKYNKGIDKTYKYEIPFTEYISENSDYTSYIISTDNIITTLIEKITINYTNQLLNENKNTIINYCNSYDTIESSYKLQCTYKDNRLTIINTYYLDKLNSETISNNLFTINRPIKKNSKLNEYLKNLEYNNILYQKVDEIN